MDFTGKLQCNLRSYLNAVEALSEGSISEHSLSLGQ